jgi:hypothetical protein
VYFILIFPSKMKKSGPDILNYQNGSGICVPGIYQDPMGVTAPQSENK